MKKYGVRLGIILLFSFLLTGISLYLATGSLGLPLWLTYYRHLSLILLNWLPIAIGILILDILVGKLWISCGAISLVTMVLGLVNYFKLTLRNDPLTFADLELFSEARSIVKNYDINLDGTVIIAVLLAVILIAAIAATEINFKDKIGGGGYLLKVRIAAMALLLVFSAILYAKVYKNGDLYYSINNYQVANASYATDQFISRGSIYPFLYSSRDMRVQKLASYDEKGVETILEERYTYSSIPNDKKVNIISIMLEAYGDLMECGLDIREDVYGGIHQLEKESVSGRLLTNVFSAGTITTEEQYLTGYTKIDNYRKEVNSYPWYFRKEGYTVEGSHPGYKWFYNRIWVNEYLGFENYYFYEDRYSKMVDLGFAPDNVLFPDIIDSFNKNKASGKPYFNFSVTVQNHGPYLDTELVEDKLFTAVSGLTPEGYNITNNYLDGIRQTNQAICDMVDYFREEQEPVVLVFFGDHKPWLGNNHSVYDMLGINLDTGTREGHLNYYSTPYFIWANPAAREQLQTEFVGKGPDMGPYLLMNYVCSLIGIKGNEFMQAGTDLLLDNGITVAKYINGAATTYDVYFENGQMKTALDETAQPYFEQFLNIQYYWMKRRVVDK